MDIDTDGQGEGARTPALQPTRPRLRSFAFAMPSSPWSTIAERTGLTGSQLRSPYYRGHGLQGVDALVRAVPDVSAPSTTKFNTLRDAIASLVGLRVTDVYVAYSSMPGNAKARIEQSARQTKARLGVLVVASPDQLDALRSGVALAQRPLLGARSVHVALSGVPSATAT